MTAQGRDVTLHVGRNRFAARCHALLPSALAACSAGSADTPCSRPARCHRRAASAPPPRPVRRPPRARPLAPVPADSPRHSTSPAARRRRGQEREGHLPDVRRRPMGALHPADPRRSWPSTTPSPRSSWSARWRRSTRTLDPKISLRRPCDRQPHLGPREPHRRCPTQRSGSSCAAPARGRRSGDRGLLPPTVRRTQRPDAGSDQGRGLQAVTCGTTGPRTGTSHPSPTLLNYLEIATEKSPTSCCTTAAATARTPSKPSGS